MLLSTFRESDYFQSSLPSYDRRIMDILDKYTGSSEEVCSHIKEQLTDTVYKDGDLFESSGTQTPSSNSLFIGSCVLVNKDINHRVIVNKNNFGNFNLFSCYLNDSSDPFKNDPFCPYEVNK